MDGHVSKRAEKPQTALAHPKRIQKTRTFSFFSTGQQFAKRFCFSLIFTFDNVYYVTYDLWVALIKCFCSSSWMLDLLYLFALL